MAFKLQSGNGKGRQINRVGNIALEVDEFDKEKNAVVGTNIATGESMTVRMANTKEFAAFYVTGKAFDTEEKRMTEARRQTKSHPTAKSMSEKVEEGGVMQMQNVVLDNNGDHVARWGNAVTTNQTNQAAVAASVQVNVPRDDDANNPRRTATIVLVDESFVPTPDTLDAVDNLLSNNRAGGLPFNFEATTGVTASLTTEDESQSFRLMTGYDKEMGTVIAGLEANVTRQPYNNAQAKAQTVIAAKAGIPFEKLQEPTNVDGYDREYHSGLYEAVLDGEVDIAVAPTVEGSLMPHVRKRVIDSEHDEKVGKQYAARLSNRGYFDAHIGIQQGDLKPESNQRYQAGVREVAPVDRFLKATTDPNFVPVYGGEMGSRIADVAFAKQEAELQAAKKMQNDQDRSRTADQDFGQPAM